MNERYFQTALSNVLVKLFSVLFLVLGTMELWLLYISYGFFWLFALYWLVIAVSGYLAIRTFLQVRQFKTNIENEETELPELKIQVEDSLKACLYYRNGASFSKIAEDFHLSQAEQARRYVVKGLDILLKEHQQRMEKP